MVFAAGSLTDDLRIGPSQMAEVIGQGDASEAGRCGGTAALADGDVILNAKRQRNKVRPVRLEYFAIGGEDEVIFQALANFLVASGSGDGEVASRFGIDFDVEIHRQRRGIEGGT